jgi:hypothetical protein
MVGLQAVANSLKIEQEKSFKDSKLEIKLSELDVMLTKHLEMVE